MSSGVLTAIVAVVVVALLGLLLRRSGPGAANAPLHPADEAPGLDAPDDAGAGSDEDSGEALAITSDGLAFIPLGGRGAVRLSAAGARRTDEAAPRSDDEVLQPGDLIAARVRRGAPDHDPWRLEALGRDRNLRAWRFETEEASRTALELVERCIVRAPRDENGDEVRLGDDAYAEARRLEEEIESELASMPDVDESGDAARRPLG